MRRRRRRNHGLSPLERWRRTTRTLSRIPYLARHLPHYRRPLTRLWFYANDRAVGYTRREAWRNSGFDVWFSRMLRRAL